MESLGILSGGEGIRSVKKGRNHMRMALSTGVTEKGGRGKEENS